MKVTIDGVEYVPVGEVPGAEALMRALGEFWDQGQIAGSGSSCYRWLKVSIDDDVNDGDTSIEDFVAKLIRKGAVSA